MVRAQQEEQTITEMWWFFCFYRVITTITFLVKKFNIFSYTYPSSKFYFYFCV